MKRKMNLSVLIGLFLLLLVGFGKKSVELLNDSKLIDLDAAIGIAKPGGDAKEEANSSNQNVEEDSLEHSEEKSDITDMDTQHIIVIKISEQKVTYDSIPWADIDKLEEKIRNDNRENVCFSLVDDFAEVHVYKKVLKILTDLHSEIGLIYTKE